MSGQFLFAAIGFGMTATIGLLTAMGVLPGPTAVIDAWSVMRPTLPRRWLAAAFWCTLVLPIAGCGILVGTAAQALSSAWNDVAQFLFWLAMGVDAMVMRRRLLLTVAVVFLAFSAYEVTTHW